MRRRLAWDRTGKAPAAAVGVGGRRSERVAAGEGVRVLITGGAGYIGTHTALELVAAGHDPVLLDNFSNASRDVLPALAGLAGRALPCIEGDIRDGNRLDRVFGGGDFDAVVHLAALKAVGESVKEPLRYHDTNLGGTGRLLDAMDRHAVRSVVFSSTATVYGPASSPLPEGAATGPASPYARTKLAGEELLRELHAADPRWRISVLRYFNAAGAHSSGRIGESPAGRPQNLLPVVAEVAAGRQARLDVFGGDYPTPDGTCVRDYVHVVDLARAHVRALARLACRPGVAVHNLGTGRGHSVLEVVRAFERASGRPIPFRVVGRRPGDPPVLCADPGLAQEELGWVATLGLDEMCADLWRWRAAQLPGPGK